MATGSVAQSGPLQRSQCCLAVLTWTGQGVAGTRMGGSSLNRSVCAKPGGLPVECLHLDGGGAGAASSSSSPNEVQAPGAYRSLCVELKLHHLVVNAIDKVWTRGMVDMDTGRFSSSTYII